MQKIWLHIMYFTLLLLLKINLLASFGEGLGAMPFEKWMCSSASGCGHWIYIIISVQQDFYSIINVTQLYKDGMWLTQAYFGNWYVPNLCIHFICIEAANRWSPKRLKRYWPNSEWDSWPWILLLTSKEILETFSTKALEAKNHK